MRSALALAGVAAVLAGCGGGSDENAGYPSEAVDRFVAECRREPGATADTCRCVIARLQETMPYAEFERADAALERGDEADAASIEKLRAAVAGCA